MDTRTEIKQVLVAHGVDREMRPIDFRDLIAGLDDLVERIVEAHAEAAFDRGIAAEQLRTK